MHHAAFDIARQRLLYIFYTCNLLLNCHCGAVQSANLEPWLTLINATKYKLNHCVNAKFVPHGRLLLSVVHRHMLGWTSQFGVPSGAPDLSGNRWNPSVTARPTSVSFLSAAAIVLTAIFLFDVMAAIIKFLGQSYPPEQLSMFRNLFGLLPAVLILLWSKNWIEAGRPLIIRQWKLGLLRGGFVALAQLCFYLALSQLEFATATSIAFSGPLFITALSIPILGHRVGLWRWIAVLIGFTGVMLVMRPGSDSFTWYAILPLCAAFNYALISVSARLFDDSVPTALINIYSNVGALAGSLTLVATTGGYVPVGALEDWLLLIAMGCTGGIAVFCLVTAYRLADPSSLSPFEYFGIPFSFFLGWVVFAEAPLDRLIPGVFLIVGGGLLIVWREHVQKTNTHSGD